MKKPDELKKEQKAPDYKSRIEALLFASGRLMDADTLLNLTGASGKEVLTNNIAKLKEEYEKRDSPLMIVEEKDGWKLTVREAYLPLVRKIVSETELPKTILETLAVIAWKAPVLQSEVIEVRHNKAYEHIQELEELEFIKKEPKGRSMMIKLTEKFYTYFDVEGAKDIRDVFSRVVGKAGQAKVDDFASVKTETQVVQPGSAQATAPAATAPEEEFSELEQEKEKDTAPENDKEGKEEFSEL